MQRAAPHRRRSRDEARLRRRARVRRARSLSRLAEVDLRLEVRARVGVRQRLFHADRALCDRARTAPGRSSACPGSFVSLNASLTELMSPLRIISWMCGVFSITSTAATRLPSFERTSRCEMIARRYCARSISICLCCSFGNMLMMRSSVSGELFACSVASARWPVPARSIAACIVSRSRISPIRITSGACAHRAAQRAMVRLRVEPDLALVDDRVLVAVQELDRVLDRDDVDAELLVAVIDHRRERRRLARAGRADHRGSARACSMIMSLRISGRPSSSSCGMSAVM